MDWKYRMLIFLIAFTGMCCLIEVDQQCMEITGEGGKLGLAVSKTEEGHTSFCFYGLEGELGR